MPHTLQQLAEAVGASIQGDAGLLIHQVCSAESAGPGKITFINEPRYIEPVRSSAASAVIATSEVAGQLTQAVLIHPELFCLAVKLLL